MNIEIQIPDWLRQVTVRIDAEGNFCMTGKVAMEANSPDVRDGGAVSDDVVEKVGEEVGGMDETADQRRRRLGKMRQQKYRQKKRNAAKAERDECVTVTRDSVTERDKCVTVTRGSVTERDECVTVTHGSVTERDECVTERDENIDCLIDCNQEINIFKNNQSSKQADKQSRIRMPVQKSVARASRDTGAKKRDNCVTERDRREWAEGQLPLPKVFDGDRPNLQIPEVQEAMTRWLTMRRREGYFKLRLELWLDMLDQVDMTVQKNGVAEAVRWLDIQTEAKRLGRFLEYEPPPRPKSPPPPPPPEPELTPEQEVEYQKREEEFYRKLGGDALARYLKNKKEKK